MATRRERGLRAQESGCNTHLTGTADIAGAATSQRQLALGAFRSLFTCFRFRIGTSCHWRCRCRFAFIDNPARTPFTPHVSCATLPLSSSMFPSEFLAALVALLLIASVRADTNITIDDTDPRIVYKPKWSYQGNVRPCAVLQHPRTLTRT